MAILLCCGLSACATATKPLDPPVSRTACGLSDWRMLGRADADGGKGADALDRRLGICGLDRSSRPANSWVAGYRQVSEPKCTEAEGYRLGRLGRKIPTLCSTAPGLGFLDGYRKGARLSRPIIRPSIGIGVGTGGVRGGVGLGIHL
jgi:hypothetical protein